MINHRGGIHTELLRNAVTGVNIIPTMMLGLMLLYWIIAIIGAFDFDFFDFDLEMDGADGVGPLNAFMMFLGIKTVPIPLVFSLLILDFWIICMLMYLLPITAGGWFNALLFIPAMVVSVFLTRLQMIPLRGMFKIRETPYEEGHKALDERCTLLSDASTGQLGQAAVQRDGANIVINVRPEFETETFKKGEVAFVFRKDDVRDIYYITRPLYTNSLIDKTER